MTHARLDTILANLEPEEREVLLGRILDELTYDEAMDALASVWDRVRARATTVYAEYLDERARIDAEAAGGA